MSLLTSQARDIGRPPSEPILARPVTVRVSLSKSCAACKAVLDISLALFLLMASSPAVLLAMLLIKLTSPGPAIYMQTRVGKNGKPFVIYKLRTMAHQCENHSGV